MTVQEAYNFFESSRIQASKESEIKIYKQFLQILAKLQIRDFSKDEIQALEIELDSLDLGTSRANNKKHYAKILREFEEYLKDRHSLTSEGYYSKVGLSMGSLFGVVVGILIGERTERSMGLAMGIGFGMLIGMLIGRHMDARATTEGKVL